MITAGFSREQVQIRDRSPQYFDDRAGPFVPAEAIRFVGRYFAALRTGFFACLRRFRADLPLGQP
jgi:hypothetical protein